MANTTANIFQNTTSTPFFDLKESWAFIAGCVFSLPLVYAAGVQSYVLKSIWTDYQSSRYFCAGILLTILVSLVYVIQDSFTYVVLIPGICTWAPQVLVSLFGINRVLVTWIFLERYSKTGLSVKKPCPRFVLQTARFFLFLAFLAVFLHLYDSEPVSGSPPGCSIDRGVVGKIIFFTCIGLYFLIQIYLTFAFIFDTSVEGTGSTGALAYRTRTGFLVQFVISVLCDAFYIAVYYGLLASLVAATEMQQLYLAVDTVYLFDVTAIAITVFSSLHAREWTTLLCPCRASKFTNLGGNEENSSVRIVSNTQMSIKSNSNSSVQTIVVAAGADRDTAGRASFGFSFDDPSSLKDPATLSDHINSNPSLKKRPRVRDAGISEEEARALANQRGSLLSDASTIDGLARTFSWANTPGAILMSIDRLGDVDSSLPPSPNLEGPQ